jgi:hypothetical protein
MIVGSERARTAKTAGSTLAEAGKINESLMYLGQCLQMQSEIQEGKVRFLMPMMSLSSLTRDRLLWYLSGSAS